MDADTNRSEAKGFTRAASGPEVEPGANGVSNPNFVRYRLNRAAAMFAGIADQTSEAMRRMNLPEHHDAALPPKTLLAALVLLREEAGRSAQLLDDAITEIAAKH